MLSSFWRNRDLILQLFKREVHARYKGSFIGVLWSFITPILMLVVYTFVFKYVFNARWPVNGADAQELNFAIVLFSGLIIHAFLSDVINRSPSLMVSHVNFVKKVVFPLEVLSWVAVLSSLFNLGIGFLLLLIFCLIEAHPVDAGVLLLPAIILPFVLMMLGISWILAALGVYVRDILHVTGTVSTFLLFVSPVFYSIDTLPTSLQTLLYFNPISLIVSQVRLVLFYDQSPDFFALGVYYMAATAIAYLGFRLFRKMRRGFSDVL